MGGFVATLSTLRLQPDVSGLVLFSAMIDVQRTATLAMQEALGGVLNWAAPEARIVPGQLSGSGMVLALLNRTKRADLILEARTYVSASVSGQHNQSVSYR